MVKKPWLFAVVAALLLLLISGCDEAETVEITVESQVNSSRPADDGETAGNGPAIGTGKAGETAQTDSTTANGQTAGQNSSTAKPAGNTTAPSTSKSGGITTQKPPVSGSRGKMTIIDDSKDRTNEITLNKLFFAGNWIVYDDARCYNGTGTFCWVTGQFFAFQFEGVQFEYIGEFVDHGGISYIYIDDKKVAEVDQYGPGNEQGMLNYTSPMLEPGLHTVKVVDSGKQNPLVRVNEGSGSCLSVDRINVYAAP